MRVKAEQRKLTFVRMGPFREVGVNVDSRGFAMGGTGRVERIGLKKKASGRAGQIISAAPPAATGKCRPRIQVGPNGLMALPDAEPW